MSCEMFTTEIEGHSYAYTQLTAKKSLALKYKLIAIAGAAVTEIVPALKLAKEEQISAFGKAMQAVFVVNDPDSIVALIERIFVPAFRDNERIDLDKHFTGHVMEMYPVLFWVLQCEYGNFINGLDALSLSEDKTTPPPPA